jgi:hypothetical protein
MHIYLLRKVSQELDLLQMHMYFIYLRHRLTSLTQILPYLSLDEDFNPLHEYHFIGFLVLDLDIFA